MAKQQQDDNGSGAERRGKRSIYHDREVLIMSQLVRLLMKLDPPARKRVIEWAASRCGAELGIGGPSSGAECRHPGFTPRRDDAGGSAAPGFFGG